jgi:hypothetical protein
MRTALLRERDGHLRRRKHSPANYGTIISAERTLACNIRNGHLCGRSSHLYRLESRFNARASRLTGSCERRSARPVPQRLADVQLANKVRTLEIRNRPSDPQHAMAAACGEIQGLHRTGKRLSSLLADGATSGENAGLSVCVTGCRRDASKPGPLNLTASLHAPLNCLRGLAAAAAPEARGNYPRRGDTSRACWPRMVTETRRPGCGRGRGDGQAA